LDDSGVAMNKNETTSYLEMTSPADLVAAKPPKVPVEIRRAGIPSPELSRFFYTAIGGDWFWIDRLPWTYADWMKALSKPGYETWVAYVDGTPAGYFELDGEDEIEIAYFGLLPQFAGKGIGGHLLTAAIRRAWERKPKKVWVHTSSFDHEHALANYKARGFRLVKTEESAKELPDRTPGPWPGAERKV
jgi:GNAT superfamily N-acetyltransferase